MTHRVSARFVDDLDGFSPATQVVVFEWQETVYWIDLTDEHAAQFRRRLQRYVSRARRGSRP